MLLGACSTVKDVVAPTPPDVPSLAALGSKKGQPIRSHFDHLGHPVLSHPLTVTVREIPFDKASFQTYAKRAKEDGKSVEVTYIDSLKTKPTYIQMAVEDKIVLRNLLNNEDNKKVRSYLEKDGSKGIVTQLSFYMDPMEASQLLGVQKLELCHDSKKGMALMAQVNGQKTLFDLRYATVFQYELNGFCWGEDLYGRPRIETINEGGACPKGLERKAAKLDREKSYLKL